MRHPALLLPAIAIALVLPGCGTDGGQTGGDPGSPGTGGVSSSATGMAVRRAGVAEGTVAWAGWWATDAMLGQISAGKVTAHHATSTLAAFTLPTSGDIAFDLDQLDGVTDLYPRASGTISVHYSGTATPSAPTGSGGVGAWTLTATTTSVVTRHDTLTGGDVTIPSGTVIAVVSCEVTCNRVDGSHWTMSCDCRMPDSGDLDITLDESDASGASAVRVRGSRTFSWSGQWSGSTYSTGGWPSDNAWTADVSDGASTHTVEFGLWQPSGGKVDGAMLDATYIPVVFGARVDAEGQVGDVTVQ
jgi:hypothetical protein